MEAYMCESVCRLQEIKTLLNKNLKLIKISYVGIKSDNKNIRIDSLLRNFSKQAGIPNVEGFDFFDLNNAIDGIRNSNMSDDYKEFQIKRINNFKSEFYKFKRLLIIMRNARNKINDIFLRGEYNGLKFIYTSDIEEISYFNNKLNDIKKMINIDTFEEGIIALMENFRYKIKDELTRHKIQENEEVVQSIEKCFDKFRSGDNYINNINIRCNYIVDLSHEILISTNFINRLNKINIEFDDKELIKEYYKLSRSNN
ncbi:hypothetical protein ACV6CB_001422 [Clostridium perfringens]|uniref:hypothetical protein n=3 Tax=Clostridium perfringens TaxID=1502 RepID=UPI001910F294|nr:hypothetical protein [Clostridium perfringens]MDK0662825.1 hypothetical protein [Clostridium perfringens]MDK0885127.1 hypothetical protein [Clostridium perfringens]MDU6313161.1 hypothetical protein [Clostridium perfringens]QQA12234.1 hypothetical protein I6G89_00860 [Clostridium perfringens]